MANNKGENTSAAKPRRFVVGTVLSCLKRLRRRQPKAPQVLDRSLATTVRRGSGRKTVPLDVEVERAYTSAGDGGGEIKEVAAGEERAEITHVLEDEDKPVNRSLNESPALPKQEMEQITPLITQDLGSESISLSNEPSLCVTEDLGSASTVAEDQHLANRDATKSLDQSSASSKQEMHQNAEDLSSKSTAEIEEKPTSSNLSDFDVSPLPSQLVTENTDENTMVENATIVSGNGHDNQESMDQSLKQEMGHMQDSSGKSMAKLEYDPTLETPTSSNTNDFDASPALPLLPPPSIPLLPSSLPTENVDQNTEELAVSTTVENSSLISNSNDHQRTSGKTPEQSSDSWKLTMDPAPPTTLRDESTPSSFLDSMLVRSTSTPSRRLSHLPTIPYPSFFPIQSDDQLLAGNTEKKAVDFAQNSSSDMPALPLKPESTNIIGEESQVLMKSLNASPMEEADRRSSSEVPLDIPPISFPPSAPFSLSRKLLPWMNGDSSPYGYLLLVPIGVAIIFLALLSIWGILLFFFTFGAAVSIFFAVGVIALSAFAVFAVAGTAAVSVWAGILWAVWVGARTGLVVTKSLIAMVSSAARPSMAVDV